MTQPTISRLDELTSGAQFHQYRMLERIGFGGQAVVWSALDIDRNRVVAIKLNELSTDELSGDTGVFDQQARLIASLNHPNILPLTDFGLSGRIRYLIAPYIPAGSLRDLLDSTALSNDDMLALAAEIASALEYLHQHKIVHRDLKATNILLDVKRHVYLADFGLARVMSATTQALHTGHGTPPYAPPEQQTASSLSPQSDIYSFGILIYEMITRHLPWYGEKSLGIIQLTGPAELPDPCDLKPDVPERLAKALRWLTAARADDRPQTAGEAFEVVRRVMQPGTSVDAAARARRQPAAPPIETVAGRVENARSLLQRAIAYWKSDEDHYPLTMTRFAVIDAAYGEMPLAALPLDLHHSRFMLYGALAFGHHVDPWWQRVLGPREKLSILTSILRRGDEEAIDRVIGRLSADTQGGAWALGLPASAMAPVVNATAEMENAQLGGRMLAVLPRVILSPPSWQQVGFGAREDVRLAGLAMANRPQADEAARLIGHVRSETAVNAIYESAEDSRLVPALATIYRVAGSLPRIIPRSIRFQIWLEYLLRQLVVEPGFLVRAYLTTAAGCFLGLGLYAYLVYRLPTFMDTDRILAGLVRGLFVGPIVGLGLFLIRLLAQRLSALPRLQRMVAGVVAGGLVVNLGIVVYYILFLKVTPAGWLVGAGSFIIAFGFGLAAIWARHRWLGVPTSLLAIGLALGASWALHVNQLRAAIGPDLSRVSLALAATISNMPLLYYEYDWPPARILLIILVTALPMAVLGNLLDLSLPPRGSGAVGPPAGLPRE